MSCLLQSGCQHYSISLQHDESFQDVFDQITYFVMLPLLYLLSQLKEIAINCESFYIAIYVLNWFSFLISCVLSLLLKNQNWEHVDLQFNIIIILYFLKILYSTLLFWKQKRIFNSYSPEWCHQGKNYVFYYCYNYYIAHW